MTDVTKRKTIVSTKVLWDIVGAPQINRRYAKTMVFQPDLLEILFVDGEPDRAAISGNRVLKSGRPGERIEQSYSLSWEIDELPDWAKPYLTLDK